MDYEKAYKEALEKARKKYNSKYHPSEGPSGVYLNNADLEEIFPALKESEDERIIDDAIQIIRASRLRFAEYGSDADKHLKAIAWLEKQKEQKPAEIAPNQFDGITYGMQGYSTDKPAEWSEEDEKMLKNIEYALHKEIVYSTPCGLPSGTGTAAYKYQQEIDWLKSLRPQLKAELTLLDENIIEAAVAFIEQNDHFNVWRGIDKHTVLKALRSLKPHWKPSEEQMGSLRLAIDSAKKAQMHATADTLNEIYEQLKKL